MPFTPFHMGPGILIKAILQSSFSLMVFGWAQIIMDLQPLFIILNGHGHIHGFSHTYIGAGLLAIFSALSGKYLSEQGLLFIGISKPDKLIKISWWVVFSSAFIGTFSHVFLDSMMHADVEPFYPFALSNNFLGLLSYDAIYKLCVYSGLLGAAVYYLVYFLKLKETANKRK